MIDDNNIAATMTRWLKAREEAENIHLGVAQLTKERKHLVGSRKEACLVSIVEEGTVICTTATQE